MGSYRNPWFSPQSAAQIDQGMSNLAQMFAPPSMQDVYLSQKMKDLKTEAAQKAAAIQALSASNPGVVPYIQAGVSDPVKAASLADLYKRAQAPGATPGSLDNGVYALHGNYANTVGGQKVSEAGLLQRERESQAGQTTRTLLQPIQQDAIRYVPPGVASLYQIDQQQRGIINTPTGDEKTLPDGTVIKGREAQDKSKAQTFNYATPDGKRGFAVFDQANGGLRDSQSGAVLPQGTTTYGANVQGDQAAVFGQSSQNEAQKRLADLANIDDTAAQLMEMVKANPGSQGIVGALRSTVQNAISTGGAVGQLMDNSQKSLLADIQSGVMPPDVAARFMKNGAFDPNIPAINLLQAKLASDYAKTMSNDGRISGEMLKKAEEALGGQGFLANPEQTLASIGQLRQIVRKQADNAGIAAPEALKLFQSRGKFADIAAPAAPAAAPPAQAGAPAGARRLRYDANGNLVPQ